MADKSDNKSSEGPLHLTIEDGLNNFQIETQYFEETEGETWKGLMEMLGPFMEEQYAALGANTKVSDLEQVKIDGLDFYKLVLTITVPGLNETMCQTMYTRHFGDKSLKFTLTHMEEEFYTKVNSAIMTSKFTK